ncbi:MAG: patatin-like phospholipase family protein, partial [Deltaproteobacteria bacterium]|nr:patatin-like phospholipase family protein [Deltaproteobacteria bacterium]
VDGPRANEWDRFHSVAKRECLGVKHIEASCSIPFFLPPVRIGDHFFVDGGVRINRPFSAAISMGATRILCIRTGVDEKHPLPRYRSGFKPGLGNLANLLIRSVTDDFAFSEREQIKVVNRLHAQLVDAQLVDEGHEAQRQDNALFERDFDVRDYQPIDVTVITPSIKPSRLYEQFCAAKPSTRPKARWRHLFWFDRGFIAELIALGYKDAEEQRDSLRDFFTS